MCVSPGNTLIRLLTLCVSAFSTAWAMTQCVNRIRHITHKARETHNSRNTQKKKREPFPRLLYSHHPKESQQKKDE